MKAKLYNVALGILYKRAKATILNNVFKVNFYKIIA